MLITTNSLERCNAWVYCKEPASIIIKIGARRLFVCADHATERAMQELARYAKPITIVYANGAKMKHVIISGTHAGMQFWDDIAEWRRRCVCI